MTAGLLLTLVVGAAYLAAHVAAEWMARRFLIVSGAEYLVLGVLLGPEVMHVINPSVVDDFAPFMTLAMGWIGAVVGAQFYIPELARISGRFFRVALVEALITLVGVSGVMVALFIPLFDLTLYGAAMPAIALGAIATASAPSGIGLITRMSSANVPLLRQLHVATAVDAFVAITAFGLLFAFYHPAPPAGVRPPTATEWAVITIALGVVGGILFHLFLGSEQHVDRLFVGLAGALILVSGSAAYLRLSPLLPAMLVGFVLVNTSVTRDTMREVLGRIERPLYFILLIFAGAAWQPARTGWIVPVVLFLLVRLVSKTMGARVAARAAGGDEALGPNWGLGLLGHGGLAIAIALNYRLNDGSVFANVVYTAAVVSVLITDIFSAHVVRTLVTSYAQRVLDIGNRIRSGAEEHTR